MRSILPGPRGSSRDEYLELPGQRMWHMHAETRVLPIFRTRQPSVTHLLRLCCRDADISGFAVMPYGPSSSMRARLCCHACRGTRFWPARAGQRQATQGFHALACWRPSGDAQKWLWGAGHSSHVCEFATARMADRMLAGNSGHLAISNCSSGWLVQHLVQQVLHALRKSLSDNSLQTG